LGERVLAGFDPLWPILNLAVADFEILLHCNRKVIISCPNAISFVYPEVSMRSYHVIAVAVFLTVGFAVMVSLPSIRAQRHPTNIDSIQLHENQH
jgi:hypothetical protein